MINGHDLIARLIGSWSYGINVRTILFRVLLAVILAAFIGWERSSKRHAAGLRTFIMIAMASNSASMVDAWLMETKNVGIPAISAAVVIGASMISVYTILFSSRNQIKGLTTAVGLWISVVIGIALGLGFYTVALVTYVALLCILFWFPPLEMAFNNRSNHFEVHLELTSSVCLQDFVTVIRRLGLRIDEIEQNPAYVGSGLSVYTISISVSNEMLKKYKTHTEIIEALKSLDYVYYIEEMRA